MVKTEVFRYKDLVFKAMIEAGVEILKIYESADFDIQTKPDQSPLTLADTTSSAIIVKYLEQTGIPVICEETQNASFEERRKWSKFWLVDPLDGTREFIKRNGEFTVNVGLVENNEPIEGYILVPAKRMMYWGNIGEGAFKCEISESLEIQNIQQIKVGKNFEKPTVLMSRSHLDEQTLICVEKLKANYSTIEQISVGSSLKFCFLADGKAHLYLRFSPTMEWDTAAGAAIAIAAGAEIKSLPELEPMKYNKENLINNGFVVRSPTLILNDQ